MGIYLKQTKTLTQKDISTPLFTEALSTIAKTWKQAIPINGGMDEEDVKYCGTLMSFLKKRNKSAIEATQIDLQGIMLNEISQRERDKYHMISYSIYI